MDLEALVEPISSDAPAGPDLSYDPQRQVIEEAFDRSSDDVEWSRTIALIAAQAEQTRDAWLAVYWARAGAKSGDLEAVGDGVALLASLFERCWDTVHPTIEDYGIEGRKGACESLVRIGEFLAPLRRVPLLSHPRLGRFSGADIERFAVEGAGSDDYGSFRAAVADTSPERFTEALMQLERIDQAIRRVDAVLSTEAQAAGQTGTNFQPTYDTIESVSRSLAQFAGRPAAGSGDIVIEPMEVVHEAAEKTLGRIGSRDEVMRALNAVVDYYARAEPSSPVPIAIERIKGWIEMDFVAILQDIAPGSMVEATNVLRARRDAGDGSEMM